MRKKTLATALLAVVAALLLAAPAMAAHGRAGSTIIAQID
jgi:hypothetical protein